MSKASSQVFLAFSFANLCALVCKGDISSVFVAFGFLDSGSSLLFNDGNVLVRVLFLVFRGVYGFTNDDDELYDDDIDISD